MPVHRFGAHALVLLIHNYVTRLRTEFAHPVHVARIVHHVLWRKVNDAVRYIVFICCSRLMPREGRMIYEGFQVTFRRAFYNYTQVKFEIEIDKRFILRSKSLNEVLCRHTYKSWAWRYRRANIFAQNDRAIRKSNICAGFELAEQRTRFYPFLYTFL